VTAGATGATDELDLLWDRDKSPPVIRAGSLAKLIERATHPDNVDPQFVRDLLSTLRSFTEPRAFLDGLLARFRQDAAPLDALKRTQLRVFNLFKSWLTGSPHDFDDDDALVDDACAFASEIGAAIQGADATLLKLLAKRRTRTAERVRTIVFSKPPPKPLVGGDGGARYFLEMPLLELARQLTLIEHDLYRSIQPSEFFRCGWSRRGKEQSSPNVLAMVQRFNQVSQWVAHEILRGADPKARARRIEFWLELARELEQLNNFNGITEILAGIDNSAVYRLKRTWQHVSGKLQKVYDTLKATVSTSNAYKAQREALHLCRPPCVPYLGVYLTDLTFIEDGNKDDVEHRGAALVNFRKRRLLAAVLSEIQIYQQTPYCLMPIPAVQLHLMSQKPPNNEELYQLSLLIEPRALEDDGALPPHPCPVDDGGNAVHAAAAAAADDDAAADDAAAPRSSEKRKNRFVQTLQKAATATTIAFGTKSRTSTSASLSVSRPQLTVEDVQLCVRVPGVRTRVNLSLAADKPIGDAVAMARAEMPANHVEALKRYEPFKLVLTSDDNGVLDQPLAGGCGLVLDESRAVRSIPPDAYLWLSPMPCTVRVCNTLAQLTRAGAALVSGGTPLSYIALTFRRANQTLIPDESDVCFALFDEANRSAPLRWLRSSRSLSGHGLCSEPDASGLHEVGGVMLVFAADVVGSHFDARRSASCATISGAMSFGTVNEHRVQWLALVEFFLFVYAAPTDAKPQRVVALDNFSCSSKQTLPGFIQLRRRDGGDSIVLHGSENPLRDWLGHLLALEQTLTLPCSVLGPLPNVSSFGGGSPPPVRPRLAPPPVDTSDRGSAMLRSDSVTADVLFGRQSSSMGLSPPTVPRRQQQQQQQQMSPVLQRGPPLSPAPLSPRRAIDSPRLPPSSNYGGIPARPKPQEAAPKDATEEELERVAAERRERLRQIRAERAAIAERRAAAQAEEAPTSPVLRAGAASPTAADRAPPKPLPPRARAASPPPHSDAAPPKPLPQIRAASPPPSLFDQAPSKPLPSRPAPIAQRAPARAAPAVGSPPSRMPPPIVSPRTSAHAGEVKPSRPPPIAPGATRTGGGAAPLVCGACGAAQARGKWCMQCGAPLAQ
jgi:hypothetical protein